MSAHIEPFLTFGLAFSLVYTTACQHSSLVASHGGNGDGGLVGCSITEFRIPTSNASPDGIVVGPDGNLWFTETVGKIGSVSPKGKFVEFSLTSDSGVIAGITVGADGNLWFTELDGNRIGRITTSGTITETALSQPAEGSSNWPASIIRGPDNEIWFSELRTTSIGRIDSAGALTERQAPVGLGDFGMATGPDGNVWLADTAAGSISGTGYIVSISPSWDTATYTLPTLNAAPDSIVAGPDGNLWFTTSQYLGAVTEIGRITTAGDITEFPLPFASAAEAIAAGTDGLWFTESEGNNIGHISLDGQVTECPIPTPASRPTGIVAGPDGAIWFTESDGNQIGRLATR